MNRTAPNIVADHREPLSRGYISALPPFPTLQCRMLASPENIELLVLDVDGVLTDGRIIITDRGEEIKAFHVRDGVAIRAWQDLGFATAIITGRSSGVVEHRARELGIRHVIQGSHDKAASLQELLRTRGTDASHVAVVGDDLPDLPMLRIAGYPVAVADAATEVRDMAAFVTSRDGGHAAVREVIEHLIKARGMWDQVVAKYDHASSTQTTTGDGA